MNLCYISDQKAGHRSQAIGLINALQQQLNSTLSATDFNYQQINISQLSKWKLFAKLLFNTDLPPFLAQSIPDIILCVGHRTHIYALLIKRIFPEAKLIVLMNPSLPLQCFDYAIIPRHDHPAKQPHVFESIGMLNPLQNKGLHQTNKNSILLGGQSKRYQWNNALVLSQINQIVQRTQADEINLFNSRRTPQDFDFNCILEIGHRTPNKQLNLKLVENTEFEQLQISLQQSKMVWVTEDSLSMIYEALSAGCDVGLIRLTRRNPDRVTKEIDLLIEQGLVQTLDDYDLSTSNLSIVSLNESQRAAEWLIKNITASNK